MTTMGLAGLYSAMAPRVVEPPPPPDLDAIHAAGWQVGFAAGEAAAHAALAPLRANLAAAAAAIEASVQIDSDTLCPLFVTLVDRIAAAVLMAESATAQQWLARLGAQAVWLRPDRYIAAIADSSTESTALMHRHRALRSLES